MLAAQRKLTWKHKLYCSCFIWFVPRLGNSLLLGAAKKLKNRTPHSENWPPDRAPKLENSRQKMFLIRSTAKGNRCSQWYHFVKYSTLVVRSHFFHQLNFVPHRQAMWFLASQRKIVQSKWEKQTCFHPTQLILFDSRQKRFCSCCDVSFEQHVH